MGEYTVTLPFMASIVYCGISAKSQQEAIEHAASMALRFSIISEDDPTIDVEIEEYEAFAIPINRGNVFYVPCDPYAVKEDD